ncbi:hypothetical protein H6G89_25705 [Oscillatoria sp. FACHB-1407]|uniref:hypothetical protein n=1 Tax=Oscillatoria sp. FACHB-1407 TaxID=2692847 RepID=UPI001684ADA7|nr:hypothetical protein [Oscillatoria sp. FACHB-1407]MBD2464406.1 hypothetical protein [Oscillatoria sp. FACHB-1407]
MVNNEWLMVSGQWSVVNGQWSMVSGQWSMVSGQQLIVNGQWLTVNTMILTLSLSHAPTPTSPLLYSPNPYTLPLSLLPLSVLRWLCAIFMR